MLRWGLREGNGREWMNEREGKKERVGRVLVKDLATKGERPKFKGR